MQIWVDGDACPNAIKQILFRAASKRKVCLTIVANHLAQVPASDFIKRIRVESGCDKADLYIVDRVQKQDLVITADIILAAEIIKKYALALNPRGSLYTENNIKQVLNLRDISQNLRESGLIRGGLEALSAKEIQNFSNHLDRIITSQVELNK